MLTLNNISYIHSNGDLLFDNINLAINKTDKVALIGNNGTGKSTLLKILAGHLHPSAGVIKADSKVYYVPQHVGQFNDLTVAQALRVDPQYKALKEIIAGNATESNLAMLNDDWLLEEKCNEAFAEWQIEDVDLDSKMETLSGGQKTKVFLSGISIHHPEIVLLDEPSNHLDAPGRKMLHDFIKETSSTLIAVSHDKTLLNLLHFVYEISNRGITAYGGNYAFYEAQKEIENNALIQDLRSKEKTLRKAKEIERESIERKQKLDARGKKKQEKAGLPTISMNTFKNNAEKSTSRIKNVHAEKTEVLLKELNQVRATLPGIDKMKIDLDSSLLHKGKKMIEAKNINFSYRSNSLWKGSLNFIITSGDRMVIKGTNGSGKTTLIKIILGEMLPQSGTLHRVKNNSIYIDQDYSLINSLLSVYDQAQQFNYKKLQEHEIKIRLNRFLFTKEYWSKSCSTLSGGEKMRLMLCCLMISNHSPDMIVLDEPTNNLDIQNTQILTSAINEYKGTLLVVSHDEHFLKQMNVEKEIVLE